MRDDCAAIGHAAPRQVTLIPRPYAAIRYSRWPEVAVGALVVALLLDFFLRVRLVPLAGGGVWAYLFARAASRFLAARRSVRAPRRIADPNLVCYGNADDLAALAEPSGIGGDPYVIQDMESYWTRARWVATLAMLICVVLVIVLHPDDRTSFLVLVVAGLAHLFASRFLWALYLRVVPGRLDIMRFRPWGRHICEQESISLQAARIECHFETRKLYIKSRGADSPARVVSFCGISDPRGFARAVFDCALAQDAPPPVPGDELLG